MKKICVIGDIHGRSNWQKIDLSSYDRVVFMGDYLDPYDYNITCVDIWDNFQKILELKKKDPLKIILLFGNHDYHYLPYALDRYSRFSSIMALDPKFEVGKTFEKLLQDGVLLLGYTEPGTKLFFTHATISIPWYNLHVLKNEVKEAPITTIDNSDEARTRLAMALNVTPIGSYKYANASWDFYGYDPINGPLWWRCKNAYNAGLQHSDILRGIFQVNGHTQTKNLEIWNGMDASVAFVDILGQDKYTEIQVEDDGSVKFEEKQIC